MSRHHGADRVSRSEPNPLAPFLAQRRFILKFVTEENMKHLRQLCAGCVLVLAFSIPAVADVMQFPGAAGIIQYPGTTGAIPYPGVAGEMQQPIVAGEIQYPGVAGDIPYPGITDVIQFPGISLLLAPLF
jgi:hypothetical protein